MINVFESLDNFFQYEPYRRKIRTLKSDFKVILADQYTNWSLVMIDECQLFLVLASFSCLQLFNRILEKCGH